MRKFTIALGQPYERIVIHNNLPASFHRRHSFVAGRAVKNPKTGLWSATADGMSFVECSSEWRALASICRAY